MKHLLLLKNNKLCASWIFTLLNELFKKNLYPSIHIYIYKYYGHCTLLLILTIRTYFTIQFLWKRNMLQVPNE